MQDYPIIYEPSFVIFWGGVMAFSLYSGGLLSFATIAIMMLVLIHHEHAHVKQCLQRGAQVRSVRFTWMGGLVDAEIMYANDAVPILTAGVFNTGCYALAFIGLLAAVTYIGRNIISMDFAYNPYLQFLNSIMLFTTIMFFSNILPITINSKKYGLISTDGWAAIKYIELRDELWNEGKYESLVSRAK